MTHSGSGYWVIEAGRQPHFPAAEGTLRADVAVVGGGYAGMWSAWHLKRSDPDLKVVVLESDRFGHGPSGRNGGFVDAMWVSFASLVDRFGVEGATEVGRAADRSVAQIRSFTEEEGVDCWFQQAGYLNVSTSPSQDGSWDRNLQAMRDAGFSDLPRELDREEVAAICRSPAFREGVFYRQAATVQPARLAFGLRDALARNGVELFELSPARRVEDGPNGVEVHTPAAIVKADHLVLANGATLASIGSPLRSNVTVASSHMVITEPVPELLEEIGWTGREAISDCRALLHYFRTTPDGRIAFGWGGGRIQAGGRRFGRAEIDLEVSDQVVKAAIRYFPGLEGRKFEYAWGGPIDASATHLPHVAVMPSGRTLAAFGFTGNGVGPSQMIGRSIASRILGLDDGYGDLPLMEPVADLVRVPPDPFRYIGGNVIRAALERKEEAEATGRQADPISGAVASVPELIGFHIGR